MIHPQNSATSISKPNGMKTPLVCSIGSSPFATDV